MIYVGVRPKSRLEAEIEVLCDEATATAARLRAKADDAERKADVLRSVLADLIVRTPDKIVIVEAKTSKTKSKANELQTETLDEYEETRRRLDAKKRLVSLHDLDQLNEQVKKLLRTEQQKSTLLYVTVLWLLRHSKRLRVTASEITKSLPPALRELYAERDLIATENVRSQLRKRSRPLDNDSEITYAEGNFFLAKLQTSARK